VEFQTRDAALFPVRLSALDARRLSSSVMGRVIRQVAAGAGPRIPN
jgi:hypothetical protein